MAAIISGLCPFVALDHLPPNPHSAATNSPGWRRSAAAKATRKRKGHHRSKRVW
jgi:hypothetical protein